MEEPLHPRTPASVQGKCTINPNADNLLQLRKWNWLNQAGGGTNRRLCKPLRLAATNNATCCIQAATSLSDFVDNTAFEKLLCTVESSTTHHFVGDSLAGATNQKTHPSHTRKHVEKNLWKTSADVTFGDDNVARQGALEAPTQRVSLKQGNRGDPAYSVSSVVSILRSNRRLCVIGQSFAILVINQINE